MKFKNLKFSDLIVSTKTIIAMTNLTVNIKKLMPQLPVTDYHVTIKKRGRRFAEIQNGNYGK